MITFLFSPWGIPASYRHMEGSGVNTYKWVNAAGEAVLIKYHWVPKAGVHNLTQEQAEKIQAKNFNHSTQDLYEAIESGNFPEWEFCVQMMSDDEHLELDFDPLDDTKLWPEDQFPLLPVGKMVLNRNPSNYFAEVEQVSFGTGVLVDGLDFSDDKMLQGRTLSYSDTQRHRVGPNYLQLPINAPKVSATTNQRDGQMTFHVDVAEGSNPHVNYEPSSLAGLAEAEPAGAPHEPYVEGKVARAKIERQNNFKQAGQTYCAFEEWERADLIANLVANMCNCTQQIKDRMVSMLYQCDEEYGTRLAEGLGMSVPSSAKAETNGHANGHLNGSANGHSNGHADDPKANSVVSATATGEAPIAH
jgi:catalase